jgi:hypothetical protein
MQYPIGCVCAAALGLPRSFLQGIRDDTGNVAPLQPSRSGRHRVEEWSNSTNLGPSLVHRSVTLVTGSDPSSRQVTKHAEPGRGGSTIKNS